MFESVREIIEEIKEIQHKSLSGDFNEAIHKVIDEFCDWQELEDEVKEELRDKLHFEVLDEKLEQEEQVRELSEQIFNTLIEDLTDRVGFAPCMQSINQNPKKFKVMQKAWIELITQEIEKS